MESFSPQNETCVHTNMQVPKDERQVSTVDSRGEDVTQLITRSKQGKEVQVF